MGESFTHLHVHTEYSMLDGAARLHELVAAAAADGQPALKRAIADYYNEFYGAGITPDHVAVFAGGRPALFAILAFLRDDVTVAIEKGRGENSIAKDIRDAFKAALDEKSFHTETDDGEDVLLKKKKGPDFALVLVESTVESVRINVEKE